MSPAGAAGRPNVTGVAPRLVVTLTVDELEALIERSLAAALGKREMATCDTMTRAEVANLLRRHPNVVTHYVKTRGLPGKKLGGGGGWRFVRADVLAWVDRQGRR